MRQHKLIGVAAAAALMAGSVIAGGAAASAETPLPDQDGQEAAPAAVVLPTGDRVTVLPNGTAAIEPAQGREDAAFVTPSSPSGDIIVVPTDQVAAIEAGEEDPRRYNVSALLREGQADAAAASASELDDRAYTGLVPDTSPVQVFADEDLQKLRVSLRDRDGKAPDGSWMIWVARDGSDFGSIPIEENGEGSVALPPGDYVVVSEFWTEPAETTERNQYIFGMTPVTIEDTAYDLVLDGTDADPVSVEVERDDAELLGAAIAIDAQHGDVYLGAGAYLGSRSDAFLLPEPDLAEFGLGFIYQPVLASPDGAADPYVYNLAFHNGKEHPDDLAFSVADGDLAAVETDYRGLGVPYPGWTCAYGDYTGRQIGNGLCPLVDTAVPSERTVYYTADPEISWHHSLQAGELDEEGFIVNGFVAAYDEIFEPGGAEQTVPRGGLSSAIGSAVRFQDGGAEYLSVEIPPVGGGNDETLLTIGTQVEAELRRGGEVLAAVEGFDPYWNGFAAELPAGDAGRYTLAVELMKPPASSVFGTEASVEWRFDSAPVAEVPFQRIALPVVQLTSDGVEGGYADRRGCQEITLDLRASEDGTVVHAEAMTFAVSYDDGATWKEIELDRDGDTATAELNHPRGAKWVSVRMTAVADNGTEVEHTTIRSYGLR